MKYIGYCQMTISLFKVVMAIYGNITLKDYIEIQKAEHALITISNN